MKVLFVCRANIGRSQVAQSLFNSYTGLESESAGTQVAELAARRNQTSMVLLDLPVAHENVGPYLANEGLDLEGKEMTQLTLELVEEADKVINMAEEETWPDYLRNSEKMVHWKVGDAAGLELDSARPLFDEVKRRIKELVQEMG